MKSSLTYQLWQCSERWLIYNRLQQLGIPCECAVHQPLNVEIHTPTAALLVRSVVQQFTAPRQDLIEWLEACWQVVESDR
ncbi:hypothetical protein H6G20_14040 [Desertifilum sp. FACHB-1129]|nr:MULTISPECIES: Asr1405/Asl0597 family protein [Desertifilum]MDA0212209.1 hypothetical protein [Cyanobacteria bacterium FC1]MDI9635346.1 hypothetical protein [Geitlerinema splendidum]MBD2312788.1 hypothetical protein [Desertifilum sp. FACHB-1129]MBD2324152.1 hypothetical protein [Desertifilum sp. FACHB-866]MBD2334166.1 hypothetical protein [Desertifilum sp. FACHB-868]